MQWRMRANWSSSSNILGRSVFYLNKFDGSSVVADLVGVNGAEEGHLRVGEVGQLQGPEKNLGRFVGPRTKQEN